MLDNNNKKFIEFLKKVLLKLKPRFSFHYVAYTVMTVLVIFSVVQIAKATTPNPGHPWSEVGDGVFAVTNNQTITRTYTFPDANATILTTNTTVTVPQGGTGLSSIATGSVLGINSANTITAVTSTTGTKVLTNTTGTITWETAPDSMVYPSSGIPNSTGTTWGTSYSTSGTGTVVALANSPSFTTPSLGVATATSIDFGNTTLLGSRSLTIDTGGVFNVVTGSSAGDDFTINTSKFVVEGDRGRVGIGTASPASKLYVSQTETSTNNYGIYGYAGGAGVNNYAGYFDAINGTGSNYALYANTGDVVLNATSGTTTIGSLTGLLRADSGVVSTDSDVTDLVDNLSYTKLADGTDGNLITWSATGAPALVATGTANQILTSNGAGTAPSFQAAPTSMTYPSAGIAISTGTAWGTSITDNSTNWNTAYTNRITSLTTTGNSGASTLSSNTLNIPNYTLAGLGYSTPTLQEVTTAGAVSTDNLTFPKLIGGTTTTSDLTFQTTSGVGATGADMHFLTGNNGATEAMTILNNGNVGIGTTTPSQALDVSGKIALDGTTVAYRPTDMTGTLIIGDGGTNLSHTAGSEGYYNTFVGIGAGFYNTTGYYNTANGYQSLYYNTTGHNNTANGMYSLHYNTTGNSNTANGYQSLFYNTTGNSNTANGMYSLYDNTTGNSNTANGYQSLFYNTTGNSNTANGMYSLYDLGSSQTAGSFNVGTSYTIKAVGTTDFTAIGASANTVGIVFTATGAGTGTGTATPNGTNNNTALGYNTGRGIIYGSGNTILGANVTGLDAGLTNNIIISDGAGNQRINVDESGNVGIGTTSPGAILHLKAGTATANTAPLKLTAGTNLTTPEAGAFEYDGTDLFFTPSTTRETIAFMSDITTASHDAVTIGTANGLSLSTQILSLSSASTSTTGALSSTDWNTFNNKQPAGSYALTTNPLSQFAATTSAQLAGVLSDESGTGVFLTTTGSAANLTSFPTFNQSTTGNASTATALQTARTIFGISFNGTANIGSALGTGAYATIADYAPLASPTFTGTVSGITATMVGLGNVTNESKATMFTSPTFTGTTTIGSLTGLLRADSGVVSTDSDVTDLVDNLSYTKLADGTDGNLITWSATGAPALVATGTANQILTSNGAGTAPSFQAAPTSMTYPSAGIAISTGTAWGTSITDNSTNWNTAYTNRITSLTTTGNSGASTLSSNILNIPNYTLAGLGYSTPTLQEVTTAGAVSTNNLTFPKLTGGTTTTSDLTFQTTSGVGATGADMHFLTGNNGATEAMTILNNGNVGIGTASPATLLEISKSTAPSLRISNLKSSDFFSNNEVINTLEFYTGDAPYPRVAASIAHISDYPGMHGWVRGALQFNVSTDSGAVSEAMRISGDRNVGIGTIAPSALLNIKGNLSSSLTGTVAVTNLSATVTGTSTLFTTELAVGDSIKIGTETFTISAIASATSLTLDTAYQGATASGLTAYKDPTLFTIDNGDAVNKFTVTKSGSVGIGTTSPTAVLHLKAGTATANTAPLKLTAGTNLTTPEAGAFEYDGTDLFFTPSTTRETIAFTSDLTSGYVPYTGANANVDLGSYTLTTTGGLTSPSLLGGSTTTSDLSLQTTTGIGATGADMHFLVGNNGATEAMTILNNGNVGIGTTSPTEKLDVAGNINFSTNGDNTLISNYKGVNSDGYNIFIGGGGQNSIGDVTATYRGGYNSAFGYQSLYSNTTGNHNIANGYQSLYFNTTGYYNIANGSQSLYSNTTGTDNIANGYQSLYSNISGYDNIANGYRSLYSNTYGKRNIAIGNNTLYSNDQANNNVAIGDSSLYFNNTGDNNTAIGSKSMGQNGYGYNNTALGMSSLYYNSNGLSNTVVGYQGLYRNIYGDYNIAIGVKAGSLISTGGNNTNGIRNIYIGEDTRPLADNETNQIVIGDSAVGIGSNTVVLGNDSIVTTVLKGSVGIGTTSPTALLNLKGNLSSSLTGTVAVTNLSATVTGTSTLFTTELAVGDSIKIGTETFTISAIASATSLTLDTAYQGATASGLTAYSDPTLFAIDNGDAVNKFTVTKSGSVGIGTTSPTAYLHLKAGTATANTAPLKLTAGTNLTTAEAGAFEYDGTDIFFTPSTTRETIAFMSDVTTASHDAVTIGTANGLSLSTQILSLASASTSTTGALSSTDWNTFNNKQPAGSYALTTNPLSQFTATTSAQLAGVISDETGSGALVFGTSPTLITPEIGVATGTSINSLPLSQNNTDFNVKIGQDSGSNIVSGAVYNTFLGYGSGKSSSISSTNAADKNTAVGYNSLYSNTTSANNVAFGYNALNLNTSGNSNVAIGSTALQNNTSSGNNTAIGTSSLIYNSSGGDNLAVGYRSGMYVSGGANPNTSSDYSVFLGSQAKSLTNNDQNTIVIGYNVTGNGSNTATIGNTSLLRTYLTGVNLKAGTATAGTAPLKLTSGALLTTPEAGSVEFLTDAYYGTITTGGARKTFAFLESPVFTTPNIGSATGSITGNAGTATALAGNPTDCGVNTWATAIDASGNLTCAVVTYAGITAMTSANLASIISDETGTGLLVFNTTPTFKGNVTFQGNTSTALTGTVAVTNLSATVTGALTLFTTELTVGDAISISGVVYQVATIATATSLTLSTTYAGATATGLTANKDSSLFTINNGFGTNKLTIDKSGNVGVGTTSPTEKIEVIGNIYINNSGGYLKFYNGFKFTDGTGTVTVTDSGNNTIMVFDEL